jgi:hypothetical protein
MSARLSVFIGVVTGLVIVIYLVTVFSLEPTTLHTHNDVISTLRLLQQGCR